MYFIFYIQYCSLTCTKLEKSIRLLFADLGLKIYFLDDFKVYRVKTFQESFCRSHLFFFFKENSEHLSLSFSSLCFFLLLQSSLMSRKRYVNDLSKGFGLSDIEGLNENG